MAATLASDGEGRGAWDRRRRRGLYQGRQRHRRLREQSRGQCGKADGFVLCVHSRDRRRCQEGGVAVIDPHAGTLVKILPVEGCHPAGLAMGLGGNFLLGCTADGKEMPAKTIVMNAKSGDVVATVDGLGGSDMVNYNAKNELYYTASAKNPGGPVLGVIDATTNKLVQTIALPGGSPHSVTSETTGKVNVPVGAQGGGDGKIHVFARKG